MRVHTDHNADLTIGQVARKFKVTLQTLYFYEDEGLIHPYRAAGKRVYDRAVVERLAFIMNKKNLGHSLANIAVLLGECELLVMLTQAASNYIQPQLEAMI